MFKRASRAMIPGMLVTALVLSLAACDNSDKPDAKSAPEKKPHAVQEDSAAQLATKLNAYVGCFNTTDGSVRDSAQRYVSWIAHVEKGPTGKERNVNVLGDVTPYELESCTKAITQASRASPALPTLDAAATQYLADLTTLDPLVSQAHLYYSQGDYKDDGFAKGKQMHQPLMKAFDRFMKSSDLYGAEVEKETNALTAAQLVEIEKSEGRHSRYYRLALITQAKQLATLLSTPAPDVAGMTKAIDAYSALLAEAGKATASEPGKPFSWSIFQDKAGTFLKDCKDRMRRLRDKTPYNNSEQALLKGNSNTGWMVSGSPMRVFRSYNELVEASNRL
ncbi:YiiG family protein [Erwinia sp. HDF1-3R]|uniref:YiiG family protein n=1 Tax=Erwinia sp. HDF1-3R TaxID=3141543 RepID=UPI0031F49FB5